MTLIQSFGKYEIVQSKTFSTERAISASFRLLNPGELNVHLNCQSLNTQHALCSALGIPLFCITAHLTGQGHDSILDLNTYLRDADRGSQLSSAIMSCFSCASVFMVVSHILLKEIECGEKTQSDLCDNEFKADISRHCFSIGIGSMQNQGRHLEPVK